MEKSRAITRVLSITSGKGGVGKSSAVVNLAVSLARRGKSVLILDADFGLANVDVLLGLQPRWSLKDVFEGTKRLDEVIVTGPEGIALIPASSGVEALAVLTTEQRMLLMSEVERLAEQYDYLLIDTQAGIGPDVLHLTSAAFETICVITPEPTSLTDAYALIKILSQNYGERSVSVMVNSAATKEAANSAFKRLAASVERFLHIELKYVGFVPRDEAAVEAVKEQRAVVELFPSSPAGMAFAALAARIDSDFLDLRVKGGMQFFFRQLLEVEAHGG